MKTKYAEGQQRDLLEKALDGDKKALNNLIAFHEPFIYNVAWKYT